MLLLGLTQKVDRLSEAQEEAKRPQLRKPLLAAVDKLLPQLLSTGDLEGFRRVLSIADSLQESEEAVAGLLPHLWEAQQRNPRLGDNRLFAEALDQVPVRSSLQGQHLAGSSLLQPVSAGGAAGHTALGLLPKPAVSSGLTGLSFLNKPAAGAAPGGAASFAASYCFRCGRGDHTRAEHCKETTTGEGEAILPNQKVRFAPRAWKERYGFDSRGFPKGKASEAGN